MEEKLKCKFFSVFSILDYWDIHTHLFDKIITKIPIAIDTAAHHLLMMYVLTFKKGIFRQPLLGYWELHYINDLLPHYKVK